MYFSVGLHKKLDVIISVIREVKPQEYQNVIENLNKRVDTYARIYLYINAIQFQLLLKT